MASLSFPSFKYCSPRTKAFCFFASGLWPQATLAASASPIRSMMPTLRNTFLSRFTVHLLAERTAPEAGNTQGSMLLSTGGALRMAQGRVLGPDCPGARLDLGCLRVPLHLPQEAGIALEIDDKLG